RSDGADWRHEISDEIRGMSERLEASRGERVLKRGFGGIVDVEFLVQLFQLKYGRDLPALRTANTWAALDALLATGLLSEADHAVLRASYDFLRLVEWRLRIVLYRSVGELTYGTEDFDNIERRPGT